MARMAFHGLSHRTAAIAPITISRYIASRPVVIQCTGPQRSPASLSTLATMLSLTSANSATSASTADSSADSMANVRLTGRFMSRSSLLAIVENLLDRHVEQAGDAERQRQR